ATDIRLQVYPACAGIDPHTAPSAAVRTSLPRMRGDRPYKVEQDYVKKRFTPHARGSTAGSHWPGTRPQVYPACAGIDPSGTHRWSTLKRLPRMRGDRPTEPIEWFRLIVFTPHTRGQIAVRRV